MTEGEDKQLAGEPPWSDRKKWRMGIMATVLTGALSAIVVRVLPTADPVVSPVLPTPKDDTLLAVDSEDLAALRAAESLVASWFEAAEERDAEALSEMSPPPFCFGENMEMSRASIAEKYESFVEEGDSVAMKYEKLEARFVGSESLVGCPLAFKETDVLVAVAVLSKWGKSEEVTFAFRRIGPSVELASCPVGGKAPVRQPQKQ